MGVVVVVERQCNLAKLTAASDRPRPLACLLYCRKGQGDQNCDHRHHDKQLKKRKPGSQLIPFAVLD